ncbi:hypothetical protein FisN_8Hu067 [Fistulifera solaris]|uniref:Uncharacterized protein n=1 Tax=Fistulifera solaris TaxID=1519565 RepID=A0A1Z5JJJ6_FISSO|nr:hypothetical protein FisN_8Hu067 [Fistulifera solaris]|eukprot:GAX14096.1 hypothetical protein FisN_8Hu067 [Fistulifera solaris]
MDLTDQDEQRLREAKEYLAKHDRKKRKHGEEEKKHKRSKKDDSSRKQSKKRHKDVKKKTKLSFKKTNLGDPRGHPPARLLDAERDYFAYHQHFWVYLYREEQTTFADMEDTQQARQAFARFVDQYNAGRLEEIYYQGSSMPPDILGECRPTRHQWNFQTSRTEEKSLSLLQDGVRKQTEYRMEDDEPSSVSRGAPGSK